MTLPRIFDGTRRRLFLRLALNGVCQAAAAIAASLLLSRGLTDDPALSSLVVHGNRIFVGSFRHGVFMFDHHSETWRPAGLSEMSIPRDGLVIHRGTLYAAANAAGHYGIYRANLQFVTPEGKAAITWGTLKTE